MTDWIIGFLLYGIYLPASWLCLYPVRKYLRWKIPFTRLMLYVTAGFLVLIAGLCGLYIYNASYVQAIFYFVLGACGVLYLFSFRIQKGVLVYLFTFVFCILCCATLISYYWDAYQNPNSNYTVYSIETGVSQWVAVFIISILFILLFGKKLIWMIDHFRDQKAWFAMSIPSWIISLCAILMVPHEYENLFVGRTFSVAIHALITLIILFILTHMIFYKLTRSTYDRAAAEQERQLMSLQLRQIELQSNYITETHRIRHDFKHSVVALSSLLHDKKFEEATEYLNNYIANIDSRPEYMEFCSFPALNALLNEYIQQARNNNIRVHHSINLPEKLKQEESQLCVLMGNLLTNAIHACQELPTDDRFIKIYIDTEANNQLYLIIQNSYDENIQWSDNTDYTSQGHYGISSIKAIAEENNGIARFYTEKNVFRADIMLPLK